MKTVRFDFVAAKKWTDALKSVFGKTGNFGKQSMSAALEPTSVRNLYGSGATAAISHDETEVV
ncbi:hypothetical protein L2Y90_12930 [Burkholderia pyrrocinia]|uniref:hypothetical protein n=1 Tax=Burkholderia pyrrocinia TaxID=60550 RepID=UPI00215A8A16|nr:hypothetical protein [Burkholderia pyrrocinia]UVE64752.1 hypothetical protein L2Y90_12930 [Burkholderia pyrrocinia]